jgi:hypothetical protein
MNTQEIKTDKEYTNWDDIIDEVRVELNNQRIIQLPDKNDFSWLKNIEFIDKNYKNPKFKIGDVVHKALDYPRSALNKNQTTKAFREGDLRFDPTPRKIKQLIYMPDRPYIRYILDDKTNVSYPENELMLSKEKEEKYEVDRIINEKSINKKKYLLIKWKKYPVKDATWEPYDIVKKDLGEVVFNELYNDFKKK